MSESATKVVVRRESTATIAQTDMPPTTATATATTTSATTTTTTNNNNHNNNAAASKSAGTPMSHSISNRVPSLSTSSSASTTSNVRLVNDASSSDNTERYRWQGFSQRRLHSTTDTRALSSYTHDFEARRIPERVVASSSRSWWSKLFQK
jgi:hypothetical protein